MKNSTLTKIIGALLEPEGTSNAGNDKYITIKQACKFADVSRWTLRRWVKAGHIRAAKFGRSKSSGVRIDVASLRLYLASLAENITGGEE